MSEFETTPADDGGVVVGEGYVPQNAVPEETPPLPGWFRTLLTPEVRKAIYSAMVAIGTVLVMLGIVTSEQWSSISDASDAILGLMIISTNLVALFNITPKD